MALLADPVETPGAALLARLDDPAVAASLNQLLDHADLLAVLVTGLHEFLARGDTITDSLAEGVAELRTAVGASGLPEPAALLATAQRVGGLLGQAGELLPTVEYLLRSDLGDTRVIDVAAMASRAVVTVQRETPEAGRVRRPGLRALWKAFRDDDTRRALGFGLAVAQALGKELRQADQQADRQADQQAGRASGSAAQGAPGSGVRND